MHGDDLKVIDGAVAGAWIRPRLEGGVGSVADLVPNGFAAYARIFHPAFDAEGNPVSWTKVADALGKTAHREMQWHALVGSTDTFGIVDSNWTGDIPSLGQMDFKALDALCAILAEHSVDPGSCFFGLCTIQNWEESFTAAELRLPFLKLPLERDYIVVAGSLSAIDQIENDGTVKPGSARAKSFAGKSEEASTEPEPSWPRRRDAPNLIWPADHSWFVISEVDFDSTLVGGTTALINSILESRELEAWRVEPADSLTDDADKINRTSESDS